MTADLQRERELQEAVSMLFAAHRDGDSLRIHHAMKHLEFLDTMGRFTVWEDRQ